MGRAGSYCCGFDSCKTSEESELRHELDRRLDNRQRTAARLACRFVALRRFGRVVHQIRVMEVTTLRPLTWAAFLFSRHRDFGFGRKAPPALGGESQAGPRK